MEELDPVGIHFRTPEAERWGALREFKYFELPGQRFNYVDIPDTSVAEQLADLVEERTVPDAAPLAKAEAIVDACGWKIAYRRLGKDINAEAYLMPSQLGGFTITMNMDRVPGDRAARDTKYAAITGNLIGRSFFYAHDIIPPRPVSGPRTGRAMGTEPLELAFADAFSSRLLGINIPELRATQTTGT